MEIVGAMILCATALLFYKYGGRAFVIGIKGCASLVAAFIFLVILSGFMVVYCQ